MTSAVKAWSPNQWTTRKLPRLQILIDSLCRKVEIDAFKKSMQINMLDSPPHFSFENGQNLSFSASSCAERKAWKD